MADGVAQVMVGRPGISTCTGILVEVQECQTATTL
jgi:hypothetical protein